MVHDGSDPDRTRGMWIVPNLWKLSSSMPSAVKQGMSQRMCDPRNSSAEPRKGALGVRRRFCFARTPTTGALSKIETKLGIWLPLFHWSWSGSESNESGVALLEREPVLHVWEDLKVNRMTSSCCNSLSSPQHLEIRPEYQVFSSCVSISSFRELFCLRPWLSISPPQHDVLTTVPVLEPAPLSIARDPLSYKEKL